MSGEASGEMSTERVIERIAAVGLIPVVRAPTGDLAIRIVEAIYAASVDVVELTMTIPEAVPLIARLVKRFGDALAIGAGTVFDAETARACIGAGAAFVVSPITDAATIECCRSAGVLVMPGALTPTEIVRASQAGAEAVKVFPCGAMGGAQYIRALRAPLPQLRLVPTGGVSLANVADFIRSGATAVGVGSELVDLAAIREGRDMEVTENARRYADAIARARRASP
jgi:2-dehydro-3-deoxyphosphogluconate aldolase/(4S)-4-hydroxy-2-oxoglutarate aldolase